jgi:hypothetical protein
VSDRMQEPGFPYVSAMCVRHGAQADILHHRCRMFPRCLSERHRAQVDVHAWRGKSRTSHSRSELGTGARR